MKLETHAELCHMNLRDVIDCFTIGFLQAKNGRTTNGLNALSTLKLAFVLPMSDMRYCMFVA